MHGRGLICVPITESAPSNSASAWSRKIARCHRTDFTVSVDAAKGVTTGISAHDRARDHPDARRSESEPDDLVQPGHVFPLRAKEGGVLRRAGHTEAASILRAWRGCNRPA